MKNKIILIGDPHGKFNGYTKIINDSVKSGIGKTITLGDFGFKEEFDWFKEQKFEGEHKFLFGNHDYYPYVNEDFSLGDFGYIEEYNLFYIRGAHTIDWHKRIVGRDLFYEEELNTAQGIQCMDLYEQVKPDFIISHDCPLMIYPPMLRDTSNINDAHTPRLLNELFYIHEPKEWYFGHHHKSKIIEINKTKFQCLNILETYKFEIRR